MDDPSFYRFTEITKYGMNTGSYFVRPGEMADFDVEFGIHTLAPARLYETYAGRRFN